MLVEKYKFCRQRVSYVSMWQERVILTTMDSCTSETKTGKKFQFAPFDRSHRDLSGNHFFIKTVGKHKAINCHFAKFSQTSKFGTSQHLQCSEYNKKKHRDKVVDNSIL